MRPHGLFKSERFLSVDEHKTFVNQFELFGIETNIDLFVGQTDVDLLSFFLWTHLVEGFDDTTLKLKTNAYI
jgi:hypothetical protein